MTATCPYCYGTGTSFSGMYCSFCNGTGVVAGAPLATAKREERGMPPAVSFAGVVVGGSLLAVGLYLEHPWVLLLGVLLMAGSGILGLVPTRAAY